MRPFSDSGMSYPPGTSNETSRPAAGASLPVPMPVLENELLLLKLLKGEKKRVVFRWYLHGGMMEWSSNFGRVFPFLAAEGCASEKDWLRHVHSDDQQRLQEIRETVSVRAGHFSLEYRLLDDSGDTLHIRHIGATAPGVAEKNTVIIGIIERMSESADAAPPALEPSLPAEAEMCRIRYNYPADFLRRLQTALDLCIAGEVEGHLLMVTITNLAMILNSFGQDAAERTMHGLFEQMHRQLAPSDSIQRVARDQFAVILTGSNKKEAEALAQALHHLIRQYGQQSVTGAMHVTGSIVSVDFPAGMTQCAELLDRAYIAQNSLCEQAFRTYDDIRDEMLQSRQQMGLANYLRKAIHENRLRLAFQPVIESRTGKVAHYEALLRLIGEDGKISSAGALVPVAERMGLIDVIDQLVLEMVVKELTLSPNVTLALNVSNLTTDNERWMEHFTRLLQKHPDVAPRMIVEITETAAQRDLRQTAYFVASVQAQGALVALDDFGSGYTSFRQLKALSVDMVKIDGAFIKDLVDNADNRFFVKTLLDFTNGFGLKSVAEYVENGETAKMLMDLGIHYMQGYYFGKPENFRGWLNKGEYDKS